MGNEISPTRFLAVTPVIAATPYAVGNAIGPMLQFPLLEEMHIRGGVLLNVVATAEFIIAQPEIDLVLFDSEFTPSNDHAAFNPSKADIQARRLGTITIEASHWKEFSVNQMATVPTSLAIALRNADGIVYGQAVARTIFTPSSVSDMTFGLGMLRD